MAMITEPSEGQQDVGDHDLDTSNGDASLTLNYSGQSEDLELTGPRNGNMAPVPIAKVVDAHGFSDDDLPKTLTTLETVKKPSPPKQIDDDEEICPIEAADDDDEEEPVLLEVINTDGDDDAIDGHTIVPNAGQSVVANGESNAHAGDVHTTPNKPIPVPSAGTIEIPRELITSAEVETPIIINHVKNTTEKGEDLIAILEGTDNNDVSSVEHYEVSIANANGDKELSKEQEREIAMEQMLSLPTKKKGRPRTKEPAVKQPPKASKNKANKTDDLVNALVSDWDDGETKASDSNETEIVVEINIPQERKRKIPEPVEPTFRRSRVIKKKIIWDPDAPETAINYASLVQTSGPGTKKPRKQAAKKAEPEPIATDENSNGKFAGDGAVSPAPKKKKTSEIDKLLGDEGAINMLNSLNQSNSSGAEGLSPSKMPRAKPVKAEPPTIAPGTAGKAKAPKAKDIAQKQQLNANKPKHSTPKSSTANKKPRNAKDSNDWDYVYDTLRPADCMIFRRRSNSSFSSADSMPGSNNMDQHSGPIMSYDFDDIGAGDEPVAKPSKRGRSAKDEKLFDFTKPKAKKPTKGQTKIQNFFDAKPPTDEDVENVFNNNGSYANSFDTAPIKLETNVDESATFTGITVSRYANFNHISLISTHSEADILLTVQVMKEIENALRTLENDTSCKLVLLTTDNGHFFNTIDRSTLNQTSGEKRRTSANTLSKKISIFVQALATFKKPLVTYVQGEINGFGLRLLPLFDVVWTNIGAMFNSTHDNEIIEGCAIISTTDKLDYNTKSKLLYLNEEMTAKRAEECNIVSQVLKGITNDHLVLVECDKLAKKPTTAIETFKLIQQQTMLPKLKEALKIEQTQLSNSWTKSEANK